MVEESMVEAPRVEGTIITNIDSPVFGGWQWLRCSRCIAGGIEGWRHT